MMSLKPLAFGAALLCLPAIAIAGTVTGRVTDESGAPLAGVSVEVAYQTYNADDLPYAGASMKEQAITDADGRYEISTDRLPPGELAANAFQTITNGGREINLDFQPEDGATFASTADVTRNFKGGYVESTPDDPYGNGGVFVLNNDIGEYSDLAGAEVTLTNVDTAKTYVKVVRQTGEGLIVSGLPFGTYKASVTLAGRPMQIRLWGPGTPDTFASSVVHDFTMGYPGNQFQVAVKP